MLNILYLYLITKNLLIYFSTIINLADLLYIQLNEKAMLTVIVSCPQALDFQV